MMIRTISAVASLALLASPAFADPASKSNQANFTAELSHQAAAQSMREVLAQRGYIATSEFRRGGDGAWFGTAMKSGKPVSIALKMPPRIPVDTLTN